MNADIVVEALRREQPAHRGFPAGARTYLVGLSLLATALSVVLARADGSSVDWTSFVVVLVAAAAVQGFASHMPGHQMFHGGLAFTIAAVLLLPPELAVVVCVAQHVPDWIRNRYPWYIQTFNIANYVVSSLVAWSVWHVLDGGSAAGGRAVGAAIAAAAAFLVVNHLLLARMLLLARGRRLRESGLFALDSLMCDGVLAGIGVAFAFALRGNIWLAPLTALPIALIHRALTVPSLRDQAYKDHKTGVLNARGLEKAGEEELARAIRFGRPVSVLMCDVDGLRAINNEHGHLAGDAALVAVARTLVTELREYDLCGRFGGDEFVTVLPETGLAEAVQVAERIQLAISKCVVDIDRTQVRLGVSIGVAERAYESTLTDLVAHADSAMYEAKRDGGGAVHATAAT